MISHKDNSSNTHRDRNITTKDIGSLIMILGSLCLLTAFILLLFARIIINNRYPDTEYIQYHLQLSQIEFITSELDDTDDRTQRSSVIYRVITMSYSLCDIDDQAIDAQSYQSITYYCMVCNKYISCTYNV